MDRSRSRSPVRSNSYHNESSRFSQRRPPRRLAPRKFGNIQTHNTQYERDYDNSIFIGNLAFDTTEEDLRDLFGSVGKIVSVDIMTKFGRPKGMATVEFTNVDDVDMAISKFDGVEFLGRNIFVKQDHPPPVKPKFGERVRSGRLEDRFDNFNNNYNSNSNGMDEEDEFDSGYTFNRDDERKSFDKSRRNRRDRKPDGYEVFIINLPYSTTWQDLKDLFREIGDIKRTDIELNYKGYSRGMGTAIFYTKDAMLRAIDRFNGFELDGRKIELREGRFNYLLEDENLNNYDDRNTYNNNNNNSNDININRKSRYNSNNNINNSNNETFNNSNNHDDEPLQINHVEDDDEPLQYSNEDEDMDANNNTNTESFVGNDETEPQNIVYSTFTKNVIGGGEPTTLVYCANLPFATTINDLYDLFESFGRVNKAELKFDSTGIPTGIAVIDFESLNSAENCINKLNNYQYGGNELSVSYGQRTN